MQREVPPAVLPEAVQAVQKARSRPAEAEACSVQRSAPAAVSFPVQDHPTGAVANPLSVRPAPSS